MTEWDLFQGWMQGWFNILKSVNVTHYHKNIPFNAEEVFDNIQHPPMIKTLRELPPLNRRASTKILQLVLSP